MKHADIINSLTTGALVTAWIKNAISGKLVGGHLEIQTVFYRFDVIIYHQAGFSDTRAIFRRTKFKRFAIFSCPSPIVNNDNSSAEINSQIVASNHVTVKGTVRDTTKNTVAAKAVVTAWIINSVGNNMAGLYNATTDLNGKFLCSVIL